VMGMFGEENDFLTMKGMIAHLCDRLGIEALAFQREVNHPTFHPGRCANVFVGDQLLGTFGEVHPLVAENYDLGSERAVLAEINGDSLLCLAKIEPLYKSLPRYPAIVRDLAVVVDANTPVREIEEIIQQQGGDLMETCQLFDVYQGAQVGEGKKSVAYTVTFRHAERTLKDKEVNKQYDAIVAELRNRLSAVLRA